MRPIISWILKGMAMGAANVIPGVSGGTIAFITGIYERLINALKQFDLRALRFLLKGDFKVFVSYVDLAFMASIFLGIAVSILSLAKVLELAFRYYETLTLSFFFGLILASIVGVGQQVSRYNLSTIVAFVVGLAIAMSVAFLPPAPANENIVYVLICGIAASVSMILPGLSGSYVILLMGNYVVALEAVSSLNFAFLIPLLLGCVLGLVLFSRILSYLFKHYKDATIALLTGFVAGSLLIIWPWKTTDYVELNGKMKATGYNWNWPVLDFNLFISLTLIVLGFLVVWWIDKRGSTPENQ
ncbi:MAG: DUF368 domain-containing protein [Cyclobacteriaceae bacterium]|nr:DUF368 domain-containing protein [Cyclobacteriaceae bacterium HetDA_MAG_MS6]